jgi:anaerobic selenocysteine-containing dehydrogenase
MTFCPLSDRESDGTAKTAEWAAEICGVSAEKIRELAQLFHENTTMLMSGWGCSASSLASRNTGCW